MMRDKEVRFDLYCDKCKNFLTEEYKEPCNSCMEQFFNHGTDKPVNFKKADKKKVGKNNDAE